MVRPLFFSGPGAPAITSGRSPLPQAEPGVTPAGAVFQCWWPKPVPARRRAHSGVSAQETLLLALVAS